MMDRAAALAASVMRSADRATHAFAAGVRGRRALRNDARELLRLRARAAQASYQMDRAAFVVTQLMFEAGRDSEGDNCTD